MAVSISWTKSWSSSDDGTVFGGADLQNLQTNIAAHSHTNYTTRTVGTFTNASLSSGVLTITHSLALSAPYAISVVIFNNSNQQITPDNITGATNTVTVDLTSYGTISGTWGYQY